MAAALKTTDVRARIEEDLKDSAAQVLEACGLTVSDAIRIFLRQVVVTQGLPFEVRTPSESSRRALAQAREIRRQFDTMDEMMGELDGEAGEEGEAGRPATARRVHA
ncbi:type II toxin-antitoxin system RelB/DinJ family antitoxin [Pseudomonas sp. zfem005]|uniref:type II toxin-antitoxin system RelB/DinJ family antitoxin n=1 Tax=Pseudomonas sp. zfem005 TaxID=3078200 RepID=UPI0029285182|nr:type II toxin-antitoxin system RelB/DinJ family antitoxin [Pseudomonas sp. zfem005]MDU9415186.1 type II toxin-antitoxin system RelB/DinJ family antitoxin [Pseudomonas sp. zfem005]